LRYEKKRKKYSPLLVAHSDIDLALRGDVYGVVTEVPSSDSLGKYAYV